MRPATEIDQLLLSFCDERWLKVARIIGNTLQVLEQRGVPMTTGAVAEQIDARMVALVGSGQLKAKGDIRQWRYSEVRLPAAVEATE